MSKSVVNRLGLDTSCSFESILLAVKDSLSILHFSELSMNPPLMKCVKSGCSLGLKCGFLERTVLRSFSIVP